MEKVTKEAVAAATHLVLEGAMRLDMDMEELCARVEEVGGIPGLLTLLHAERGAEIGSEVSDLAKTARVQRWLRMVARPVRYEVRVEVASDREITLERFVPSFWQGVPPATEELAELNEAARELLVRLTWEGA